MRSAASSDDQGMVVIPHTFVAGAAVGCSLEKGPSARGRLPGRRLRAGRLHQQRRVSGPAAAAVRLVELVFDLAHGALPCAPAPTWLTSTTAGPRRRRNHRQSPYINTACRRRGRPRVGGGWRPRSRPIAMKTTCWRGASDAHGLVKAQLCVTAGAARGHRARIRPPRERSLGAHQRDPSRPMHVEQRLRPAAAPDRCSPPPSSGWGCAVHGRPRRRPDARTSSSQGTSSAVAVSRVGEARCARRLGLRRGQLLMQAPPRRRGPDPAC